MARIAAALLIRALRSSVVQSAALETTIYLGKRANRFLQKKLLAGAKSFKD